jgi:hypothetical protein
MDRGASSGHAMKAGSCSGSPMGSCFMSVPFPHCSRSGGYAAPVRAQRRGLLAALLGVPPVHRHAGGGVHLAPGPGPRLRPAGHQQRQQDAGQRRSLLQACKGEGEGHARLRLCVRWAAVASELGTPCSTNVYGRHLAWHPLMVSVPARVTAASRHPLQLGLRRLSSPRHHPSLPKAARPWGSAPLPHRLLL